MVGHVAPEAMVGGPIAVVEEGDTIVLDIPNAQLNLDIPTRRIRPEAGGVGPDSAELHNGCAGQIRQAGDFRVSGGGDGGVD